MTAGMAYWIVQNFCFNFCSCSLSISENEILQSVFKYLMCELGTELRAIRHAKHAHYGVATTQSN